MIYRPSSTEYLPYYASYIAQVPEENILTALESQLEEVVALLRPVPEAEGNVRHPPYTWSVKQVVGHVTDTERIFGYRALRFARGDATPLPGFDENSYARAGDFDRLLLRDLVSEFEAVRRSHLWLFRGLADSAWTLTGQANNATVSVRALAYIMVGHTRHHGGILRQRLAKG